MEIKTQEVDAYYGAEVLLCPACGHDMTHVDVVTVLPPPGAFPGVRVEVTGEDERTDITSTRVAGTSDTPRRHTVTLTIKCENGCRSWIRLAQHKGWTFATVEAGLDRSQDQPTTF